MKNLFTTQFLFSINSVLVERVDKMFLAAGLVLLALAAAFKLSAIYAPTPVDGKYRQKFFRLFSYIGFSEIFWYALRYESIKFFGSHFVALLVLVIGLVWMAVLVVDAVKHYSPELRDFQKEQVRLKYLQK